jgi:hypothetical protein
MWGCRNHPTWTVLFLRALLGSIYVLVGACTLSHARAPSISPMRSVQAAPTDCAQAETHWKTVEEIDTLAVYQDHLARFPSCAFATIARLKIEILKKVGEAADDSQLCRQKIDADIAACNLAIASGRYSESELVPIYLARGTSRSRGHG